MIHLVSRRTLVWNLLFLTASCTLWSGCADGVDPYAGLDTPDSIGVSGTRRNSPRVDSNECALVHLASDVSVQKKIAPSDTAALNSPNLADHYSAKKFDVMGNLNFEIISGEEFDPITYDFATIYRSQSLPVRVTESPMLYTVRVPKKSELIQGHHLPQPYSIAFKLRLKKGKIVQTQDKDPLGRKPIYAMKNDLVIIENGFLFCDSIYSLQFTEVYNPELPSTSASPLLVDTKANQSAFAVQGAHEFRSIPFPSHRLTIKGYKFTEQDKREGKTLSKTAALLRNPPMAWKTKLTQHGFDLTFVSDDEVREFASQLNVPYGAVKLAADQFNGIIRGAKASKALKRVKTESWFN